MGLKHTNDNSLLIEIPPIWLKIPISRFNSKGKVIVCAPKESTYYFYVTRVSRGSLRLPMMRMCYITSNEFQGLDRFIYMSVQVNLF